MEFCREFYSFRLSQIVIYLVIGVLMVGEDAGEFAKDFGRLQIQGIVRYYGDSRLYQGLRYGRTLGIGPYQNGYVAISGTGCNGIPYGFLHHGNLLVGAAETHAHQAFLGIVGKYFLLYVGV